MSTIDEEWTANRYKKYGRLTETSKPNFYSLMARNPAGFNDLEDIYTKLRAHGKFYFYAIYK